MDDVSKWHRSQRVYGQLRILRHLLVGVTQKRSGEIRSGGIARGLQNFNETRDTQRDVGSTVASKMEGVQSHLGGGFTNRLPCHASHSFSWLAMGTLVVLVQRRVRFWSRVFAVHET
ncbi:light- and oxygen-sensing transcription regulator, putative [Babesia ovata]|uniref:Light-and oxygen-sensing transcription regulator, putative n=1 Tax=Babesia ovata TaxID=189622 RepID=A0A2H6KBQ6_9APIC|nr:light- and oxygen-sensing transcription regulator, putative [Babesia ovata]GBE60428.1 light- and oxygen-sensing transcription regulator, putative [Babesia ovata]